MYSSIERKSVPLCLRLWFLASLRGTVTVGKLGPRLDKSVKSRHPTNLLFDLVGSCTLSLAFLTLPRSPLRIHSDLSTDSSSVVVRQVSTGDDPPPNLLSAESICAPSLAL